MIIWSTPYHNLYLLHCSVYMDDCTIASTNDGLVLQNDYLQGSEAIDKLYNYLAFLLRYKHQAHTHTYQWSGGACDPPSHKARVWYTSYIPRSPKTSAANQNDSCLISEYLCLLHFREMI